MQCCHSLLLNSSIWFSSLHNLFRLKSQQFLDLPRHPSKWILYKCWALTLKSSPVRTRYTAESVATSNEFLVITVIIFVLQLPFPNIISLLSQELQFDCDNNVHYLDIAPLKIDVGKYSLVFEVLALYGFALYWCADLAFFLMVSLLYSRFHFRSKTMKLFMLLEGRTLRMYLSQGWSKLTRQKLEFLTTTLGLRSLSKSKNLKMICAYVAYVI